MLVLPQDYHEINPGGRQDVCAATLNVLKSHRNEYEGSSALPRLLCLKILICRLADVPSAPKDPESFEI